MAQYKNLNQPPERQFRDLVVGVQAEARQSKTGAAGVKDLGLVGDVVWTRPDATAFSVRDVDRDLADARQRIEDAEGVLAQTGERLDEAVSVVEGVRGELDGIDWDALGAEVHTDGPPPANPTIGQALWVAPNGRVFRAVECEEHA